MTTSHKSASVLAAAFSVSAMVAVSLLPGRAMAGGPPQELAPFFALGEFRAGVFAASLEDTPAEGDYAINAELLFGRPFNRAAGDTLRDFFLNPRPHIGFTLSPDDGTNQLYAGFTWELRLTDRVFVEASFGGALHDGPTGSNDPDSYGCALNFRESASIGVDLSERWRVMATIDHMSNAGLCGGQNQGLTNAGVRLGYRW